MRVSIYKDDQGYRPDHQCFAPFLDGQRLDNCVTADEELGEVLCYEKENGKLKVINDDIVLQRLAGNVRVKKVRWSPL